MKHKITITAVIVFDVDPADYPDCTTDEERLAVDMENADSDTFSVLEMNNVEWSFTGEVLNA